MIDENKTIEKWSKLGLLSETTNEYYASIDPAIDDFSAIQFPTISRVMSTTLAYGGWMKSEKQQQKENRLNKLNHLKGDYTNIILPDDEYVDGITPVKPMSAPSGNLFYVDFRYESNSEKIKKSRIKKLNKLNRLLKLKYIEDILKNN